MTRLQPAMTATPTSTPITIPEISPIPSPRRRRPTSPPLRPARLGLPLPHEAASGPEIWGTARGVEAKKRKRKRGLRSLAVRGWGM